MPTDCNLWRPDDEFLVVDPEPPEHTGRILAKEQDMNLRFTNRVALVTGGASGIGKLTCQRFAEEGANVVIADIQDELGEQVALGIRDRGGDATYVRLDVTSEEDWAAAVAKTGSASTRAPLGREVRSPRHPGQQRRHRRHRAPRRGFLRHPDPRRLRQVGPHRRHPDGPPRAPRRHRHRHPVPTHSSIRCTASS